MDINNIIRSSIIIMKSRNKKILSPLELLTSIEILYPNELQIQNKCNKNLHIFIENNEKKPTNFNFAKQLLIEYLTNNTDEIKYHNSTIVFLSGLI